jgi:tetratricopeptide (TPR) repeat protein
MSSREQASTFRKHRTADDKAGNLAWSTRVSSRALRVMSESSADDIESLFELDELERIIWRLLRLPRRYSELQQAGLFEDDNLRSVLRGFVAADVVEVVDPAQAKALLPAEIKRLKLEVQGKSWRPAVGAMHAKVYRPDIGLDGASNTGAGGATSGPDAARDSPHGSQTPQFEVLLSPEEKKLKAQLLNAAASMASMTDYAFLGVQPGADDQTVRSAYMHLVRDYHPDRLSGSNLVNDRECKDAVDALFKRLGDANKGIGTADARARYDREQSMLQTSSTTSGDTKRPRRPVEARTAYAMAETFFKRKEFKQAEVHYRQAVMFDPDEPMLEVALAWCIYLNPDHPEQRRLEDARKRFEELVKKTKNGDAYYKYGRILRELGDEKAALTAFERAVERSPGHVDAQRELRLALGRKEKAAEVKQYDASLMGKLNKIFKKD